MKLICKRCVKLIIYEKTLTNTKSLQTCHLQHVPLNSQVKVALPRGNRKSKKRKASGDSDASSSGSSVKRQEAAEDLSKMITFIDFA